MLLVITKFHTDIHGYLVYNHIGYDAISDFWPALVEVRKMAGNTISDGFGSNFSDV